MCTIRKFTDWTHSSESNKTLEDYLKIKTTKASKTLLYFQGEPQSEETFAQTAKLLGAS